MTTVADLFPHLASLSYAELVARRKELIGDRSTVKAMTDAEIDECSAIVAILRRKSSGPPREEKEKAPKAKAPSALSSDDILNL